MIRLKKVEKEAYMNEKAIGVFCENNFGGLEVVGLPYGGDYVVSCFNFGNGRKNIGISKIEYTMTGRPYFRRYNRRYYFDEIMRV